MLDYIIAADNMGDLPDDYCEKHGLRRMFLSILMNGVTYDGNNRQDEHEFYEMMRHGALPVTSQITPEVAKAEFLKYLEETRNIIFLAVSSGISGTYSSVSTAAKEIMEEIPDCRITVIDTLSASMGEGLLIHKALRMKENGASYDEVVDWVEKNKLHAVSVFTVDDLFHLHRGGRVSRTTAIVGTLVKIKPVLHINIEGKLINIGKIRGRKKSLTALVDYMEEHAGSWMQENRDDCVMVSHGDCVEDAERVADMVRERFGVQDVLVSFTGPTIGAHTGPGLVTLMFMGDER